MLLAKRCPHTGVVNLFARAEPFLAIGSVVRADARLCRWHCYLGQPASGFAPDMHTAERCLVGRYRELLRAAVSARRGRLARPRDGGAVALRQAAADGAV